mmetsp:Transcript_25575/g.37184  ORF Transcript_25575/g.37184 Transcript_25575/m.37184 type:complete len:149 (+) Transcript_25575:234-680(+)
MRVVVGRQPSKTPLSAYFPIGCCAVFKSEEKVIFNQNSFFVLHFFFCRLAIPAAHMDEGLLSLDLQASVGRCIYQDTICNHETYIYPYCCRLRKEPGFSLLKVVLMEMMMRLLQDYRLRHGMAFLAFVGIFLADLLSTSMLMEVGQVR